MLLKFLALSIHFTDKAEFHFPLKAKPTIILWIYEASNRRMIVLHEFAVRIIETALQ